MNAGLDTRSAAGALGRSPRDPLRRRRHRIPRPSAVAAKSQSSGRMHPDYADGIPVPTAAQAVASAGRDRSNRRAMSAPVTAAPT